MTEYNGCPKCGADISDSYQSDDPSVGIRAGWYCESCDLPIGDDGHYEPMEDDVGIMPAPLPTIGRYGTPFSELNGHPGHKGYEEFKRIAKSWGYD